MDNKCCRKQNQIIITVLLLGLISFTLGCKTEKIPGKWAEKIITDGKIDDWQGIGVKFYPELNASVSFANDLDYIHIQFRTKDPKWVRTIKRTGITIYADNRGKSDKDFYIKFIGGPSNEQLKEMIKRDGERSPEKFPPGMNNQRQIMEDKPNQLTCFVKNRIIEKPIPLNGSEGPAAAFDTSYGFYTYEFRIPLRESTVRNYGINATLGQEIAIGAKWGGFDGMQHGPNNSGSMKMGGGGRGGGGRGGGGGGRGGPSGGGKGNRGDSQMMTEQEIWIKTILVSQETK